MTTENSSTALVVHPQLPTKVQATEVTYELHTLGWKAFQNLCGTIVAEVWGQTIQSFFDSHDGGRDGAFKGTWMAKSGETYSGTFTAQCKFTAKLDKQINLKDLKDELEKAKKLASKGLADNYFLFTNERLTGTAEKDIRSAFLAIPGIKGFAAYGSDRISQFIRESPRLRMLVPRVYGLGDLSQILDARAYAQAQEILSSLGNDLNKFVITDAHRKSAKALQEHGFLLLLGEPACGKSTIAASLAMGSLDVWKCPCLKIRNAADFIKHYNPHEAQFFWVDDAFGATQLDSSNAEEWNQTFLHVRAAISHGSKILFTSRNYIYSAAKSYLKASALPVMNESQVVIHVEELTKEEREQILYNHIRLGTQEIEFKRKIKPFLAQVAAHPRFSPEIARRLGDPMFTRNLVISKENLNDFVACPVELLCEVIRTVDKGSQSALALIFMRGGLLPDPVCISPEERQAVELIGGTIAVIHNALNALEGSLLLHTLQEGSFAWKFKHPTIRDAFAKLISENHGLMDIYLAGAPVEMMFKEVSCGNAGIEGVKVIIPRNYFDAFLTRIASLDHGNESARRALDQFLSSRCDQEFLSRFLKQNPQFIEKLRPWRDTHVIVRIHKYGLLPEDTRLAFVSAMHEAAVDTSTPDSLFLHALVQPLLKPKEIEKIWTDVRAKLFPVLDEIVDCWRDSYSGKEDPETYFDSLWDTLSDYQKALKLPEHVNEAAQIDEALETIRRTTTVLVEQKEKEEEKKRCYADDAEGSWSGHVGFFESRSTFEDVDG